MIFTNITFSILLSHLTNLIHSYFIASSDAAERWQFGPQDPATPIMEGMIFFHNYLMFFLIFIGVAVFWLLYKIVINFERNANPLTTVQKFNHSSLLEIIWTILPAVILAFIAVPSFALLYSLDDVVDPELTIKVIGHQWYWSYEYSDFEYLDGGKTISFDSYMVATDDLGLGQLRLLETDFRLNLPINTHIRVLITAADVLHSWAVPSFGIKVDACPGRLSQASIFIKREADYFGQCSEICGVNHGFMPIAIRGLRATRFTNYITSKLQS